MSSRPSSSKSPATGRNAAAIARRIEQRGYPESAGAAAWKYRAGPDPDLPRWHVVRAGPCEIDMAVAGEVRDHHLVQPANALQRHGRTHVAGPVAEQHGHRARFVRWSRGHRHIDVSILVKIARFDSIRVRNDVPRKPTSPKRAGAVAEPDLDAARRGRLAPFEDCDGDVNVPVAVEVGRRNAVRGTNRLVR